MEMSLKPFLSGSRIHLLKYTLQLNAVQAATSHLLHCPIKDQLSNVANEVSEAGSDILA